MKTGKGRDNILTKTYESKRRKGLLDSDKLTSQERSWYGISGSLGGGATNPDMFTIKQFPFPMDSSVRRKKKIDYRKYCPEIGD